MKTFWILAAAMACAGKVSVTPSSHCAAGGVEIDGIQVCNGASTLVAQTPLPVGDAHCAAGGVRIDSGLDDGRGGGIALDGVLQAGEITQTSYVCRGGSGAMVGSLTPPPGAEPGNSIDARGGDSTGGAGGNGGLVALAIQSGTNGGHIKVFRTGKADASFTPPPSSTQVSLGDSPLVVTQDTVVAALDTQAPAVPAGTPFAYQGQVYLATGGADTAPLASGLSVAAGATLTLPDGAFINAGRGCINAGTITSAGSFTIQCDTFVGASGSTLRAPGASISLYASGAVFNAGVIDVSGASGGAVYVASYYDSLVNTGAVRAFAADATTGIGGSTQGVTLAAGTFLWNSGSIDAHAGAGPAGGGSAGGVYLTAFDYVGELRNSGDIDASGGASSAGPGGRGGPITLYTYDGQLASSGNLRADGGASAVAKGGDAGAIGFYVYGHDAAPQGDAELFPAGGVIVSGMLQARGGAGATGGGASFGVASSLTPGNTAAGQEIVFYGYSSIVSRGGNGATSGGAGGMVYVKQQVGAQNGRTLPAGAVFNGADIDASGGNGGTGGDAGSVTLATQSSNYFPDAPWEVLVNHGAIVASGGSGASGGASGLVQLFGRAGATNSGAITSKGGAGVSQGGNVPVQSGPYVFGATVELDATGGALVNSGAIDVSGGSGDSGSGGGFIVMQGGNALTNGGDLVASGGAGVTNGGAGGGIVLFALQGFSRNTATRLAVAGGAGQTAGATGLVSIDGVDLTQLFNH